jgi:hypothetical protein
MKMSDVHDSRWLTMLVQAPVNRKHAHMLTRLEVQTAKRGSREKLEAQSIHWLRI